MDFFTRVEVPDEEALAGYRFSVDGIELAVSAPEGGDLEHWLADPAHEDADEISLGIATTELPQWRLLIGHDGLLRDPRGQLLARLRIERVDDSLFVVVARLLR